MDYMVEINNFEGPLDLLLHLIKESKVDICDINIEEIANQYLDYINKMEDLNLNVASEYLVMAAELIEMKSSMLLPKKQEQLADDYEEDPREQLINRLLEYERYKNITTALKEYEQERNKVYSKEPYDLNEIIPVMKEIDETFQLNDLVNALNNMQIRIELNNPLDTKVTLKEYSISERSTQIKNLLKQKKRIEFIELFDIKTKEYVVVTFLSILNMARKNELNIKQDKNFDSIILEVKEGA